VKTSPGLAPPLISAFVLASATTTLDAQPRGPTSRTTRNHAAGTENRPQTLDEASRSMAFGEMRTWLGRLTGRYQVDATYTYVGGKLSIRLSVTCDQFGDGPGIRCVLLRSRTSPTTNSSILRPLGAREDATLPLLYFGINPEKQQIQAIVVDLEQVGAQSGALEGESVKFSDDWNECIKTWAYCWMVTEISAKPTGEITMRFAVDHWFQGSKGPPIALLRSGHSAELELQLLRGP